MKVVISHVVKKDVMTPIYTTYGKGIEIVTADNTLMYDYMEDGWRKHLYERMKKNLSKSLDGESIVYFLAVGFIPAVLVAYDVLKDLGKKIVILNYNKIEEKYDEIEWR